MDSDRGETLLELLIAVMIMGVAVVVLLGGVGTSIRVSDIHRKQATASADLRAFAEAIESAVARSPTVYLECAGTAPYLSRYTPDDPDNFKADVLTVRYWDGSAFSPTCTVASDTGVQLVSLRVHSVDDLASESLDVVVRKPCRPAAEFPGDATCA